MTTAKPRVRYEVVVRAENAAGLISKANFAFFVDTEAPINGAVRVCDASGRSISVQSRNESLHLCASSFVPPLSGIAYHRVSIYAPTGDALLQQQLVRPTAIMHISGLNLPCGYRVRVVSEALSGANVAAAAVENYLQILSGCVPPSDGLVGFTSAHDGLPAVTETPMCSVAGQAVYGWWGEFASKATDFLYSLVPFGTPTFAPTQWVAAGPRQLVMLRTSDLSMAPNGYMLLVRACHSVIEPSMKAVTVPLTDELCSAVVESAHPLIIVDNKPTSGVVEMVTRGTVLAVLSDEKRLSVNWHAFGDATLLHAALNYEVCVGTTPYGCQLHPFVSVSNNVTWHGDGLDLPCSSMVYVAVRATNCAGLQRTVASSGAILCCDAPTGGKVIVVDSFGNAVTTIGTSSPSLISWSGFAESCSGIGTYTVAVMHSVTSEVLWQSNATTKLYAALPAAIIGTMQHGIRYRATVNAVSVAGHTASKSTEFVVDRTSPTLSGPEIRWSLAGDAWLDFNTQAACLPADADFIEVRWNISDVESDIATREVALTSSATAELSWQVVGASTPLRFAKSVLPGQYGRATFFLTRVCNSVQLCTTSNISGGLTQEQRSPSGGTVWLPSSIDGYMTTQVSASWSDFWVAGCPKACGTNLSHTCFYDPTCSGQVPRLGGEGCNAGGYGNACRYCGFDTHEECPIDDSKSEASTGTLTFEVCVGTTPYGCQLKPFSAVSDSTSWQANADLSLPCSAVVFVAVRATNCAGLQRTVASEGAIVCCETPAGGVVMLLNEHGDSLNFVGNASYANVSWTGFTETCSGVREYVLSLVSTDDGIALWNATGLNALTRSVLVPPDVVWSLSDGESYAIEVRAISHAGLSGTSATTFQVDRKPPTSTPIKLRWATVAPDSVMTAAACVTSDVEVVEISWDYWSDASNTLSYSIGIVPLAQGDFNTTAFAPAWQPVHQVALISITPRSIFQSKSAAAIAARACNAGGMCSQSDWSRIHLVDSPPVAGRVAIGPSSGASGGFLGGASSRVGAVWEGYDWAEPASPSVRELSYEVCVGTTPYGCQLKPFSAVSDSTSWQANADLSLPCSAVVFVAVRATNCAGLQRTVASEGAIVCCETPAGGVVMLLNEHGDSLNFVGNASYANVSWTGFTETCSGVREYVLSLVSTDDGIALWNATGLNALTRSVLVPPDVVWSLSDGESYAIEVRAISHAGLSGTSAATFQVDRTPPVAAAVFNGQLRNVACQQVTAPMQVSWTSIEDHESGVRSIVWALGLQPFAQDLLVAMRIDGDAGGLARKWSDTTGVLKPGMVVHSTLTVTNGAGSAAVFTPPPVRVVPHNCSSDFFCLPSATGVHPLMLPLVLGLVYDVSGKFTAPGFMAQQLKMDLRVHLNEVQRLSNGSRLVSLKIGRESIVRDRHGTPVESLLTMDAFTHAMMYEQDAHGTVQHVLHHPEDRTKSLQLKRLLVSAQQLARVPHSNLRGADNNSASNMRLAFTAVEEDHDGPARVEYELRKGLLGRVVYQKRSIWMPTKRRPAIIEQQAATRAILSAQGTLLHMRSVVHYSSNVSKQPLPDGSGFSEDKVEGFDFLPKDPAVFTWSLLPPPPSGHVDLPGTRQLTTNSHALSTHDSNHASFVRAKLHLDDAPETVCKLSRRAANELLNCVLQGNVANNEPRSQCVRDLVHVMAECKEFGVEARLGAAVMSPRCAGAQVAAPRACDAAISALSLLGSDEAQHYLADFVGALVPSHLRHENTLALSSIAKPHHVLLNAMVTVLEPKLSASNRHSDEDASLLLATSALAARARSLNRRHIKKAVARVDALVAARLKESKHADDQVWAPLYNVTRHSAQKLWSEMAHHQRHGWVGHHAQLNGDAHEWEAKQDDADAHRLSYLRHIDFAKEALEHAHLERHPAFSDDKEAHHHYRIVTALRAAHNARAPQHAPMLVEWLGHSNEAIAVECANALLPQKSAFVEQHILQTVRIALLSLLDLNMYVPWS